MRRPSLQLGASLLSDSRDSQDLKFAAASSAFLVLRQPLYFFDRVSKMTVLRKKDFAFSDPMMVR